MSFVEAKQEKRLLMGSFGIPGSGKSYSTCAMGCRLIEQWGLKPVICVFDTENAWGKLIGLASQAGVKIMQWEPALPPHPDRAGRLGDCSAKQFRLFLAAAERGSPGLIVCDSITHILEREEALYMDDPSRKIRGAMEANEYGRARKGFRELVPIIVGSPQNMAILGRHAMEYGVVAGKDAPIGNKMKAGGLDYELDLLLECKRTEVKAKKYDRESVKWFSIGVEKDRTQTFRKVAFCEDDLNEKNQLDHFKKVGLCIDATLAALGQEKAGECGE